MEHGDKESIRFRGKKVSELDHRSRMHVLHEIAKAEEHQAIRDILRKFPKYDAEQLGGAIRQMELNIKALQKTQLEEHNKIKEYRGLIAQCEERDRKLAAAGFDGDTHV